MTKVDVKKSTNGAPKKSGGKNFLSKGIDHFSHQLSIRGGDSHGWQIGNFKGKKLLKNSFKNRLPKWSMNLSKKGPSSGTRFFTTKKSAHTFN